MGENSICRFCMYQERCGGDTNTVLNIFDSSLIGIPEKIRQSVLYITPDDIIPPNICKNCIDIIEKFYSFLEICHKSDITLQTVFKLKTFSQNTSQLSINHLSNEGTSESSTIPKKISNHNIIRGANSSKSKDDIVDDFNESESDSSIASKFNTQDHLSSHGGQFVYSSSKCNEIFPERQKLVQHDNKHKIPCEICKRKILPKNLNAHLRKHIDKQKYNNCTRYMSKIAHPKTRRAGNRSCHPNDKERKSMTQYMACHSKAMLKSNSLLKVRTPRKHKEKNCICTICAKCFKSESYLRQHQKRIHNSKKCVQEICQRDFINNYNLKMQTKTHMQQRMHNYQRCSREYMLKQPKAHMSTHIRGHLSCPNCSRRFFYKKYLDKHIPKCMLGSSESHFKSAAWNLKNTISLPSLSSLRNLN